MHNRNKYKLLLIILIGLSCIFSTKCGEAKLRILILCEIDAAQFEFNGEEKVPVYSFDPRKEIQKSLKGAGFKVVLREGQNYDYLLRVIQKEYAYKHRLKKDGFLLGVELFTYKLSDSQGAVLLNERRNPYPGTKAQIQAVIRELTQFVQLRTQVADDASFWIKIVKLKGKDARPEEILKIGSLKGYQKKQQVALLEPYLRSHQEPQRFFAYGALKLVGYSPDTPLKKAAFYIANNYMWARWSANVGEGSKEAWAARQGVIPIIKYDTAAIALLVEDLRADWTIAPYAKAALKRLTKKNWSRFFGYYKSRGGHSLSKWTNDDEVKMLDANERDDDFWRVIYTYILNPLVGEVEVVNPKKAIQVYSRLWDPRWNVYGVERLTKILENVKTLTIDKDYFKRNDIENEYFFHYVIEILGEIGDTSTVQTLNSYVDHPKLGKFAEKAIEKIIKRV